MLIIKRTHFLNTLHPLMVGKDTSGLSLVERLYLLNLLRYK